ncbi:MAG: hypothetical protein AAFV45_00110 [Pseudomonadota bacterium]
MTKPISDQAEVAVDFPGKTYMGSFTRHSSFDVSVDEDGVHIHLEHRVGEHRRVSFHIHHHLFADLIEEIGLALKEAQPLEKTERRRLADAAAVLQGAVDGSDR